MITVNEELLETMLEQYPLWRKSAGCFLEFITLTAQLSGAEADIFKGIQMNIGEFAEELAGIFIAVLDVNISPFKNYADLKQNGQPVENVAERLELIVTKMKQDDAFFDLAEDTGIMPSIETIGKEVAGDFHARAVIEILRPYIEFR